MDQNIIPEIIAFLAKYGLLDGVIAIAVAGLTELIKIPIYRAATKYQASTGVDKSVITWTITLVAQVLSIVAALIIGLSDIKWDIGSIDWASTSVTAAAIYAASTGFYEILKKVVTAIKAFATKKQKSAPANAAAVMDASRKEAENSAASHTEAIAKPASEAAKAQSKALVVTAEKTQTGSPEEAVPGKMKDTR